MFPVVRCWQPIRLISGQRNGDQSDLAAWLAQKSPPASFAPHDPTECLSAAEWWLWRLCGASVRARIPRPWCWRTILIWPQGRHAAAERRRSEFTEYDGRVEQAGPDLDPTQSDHRVLSANRLQTIGKCPLMYFFEYGLGIAPPDELEVDPNVWLDALATGSLLHELFETVHARADDRGSDPRVPTRPGSTQRTLGCPNRSLSGAVPGAQRERVSAATGPAGAGGA